ncbi:hypothetical protein [Saccharothrix sp.]|uniref:hypothetical protein n=1 Tax=Saccharothrix sp. TaxID=1873460 RepID=UPI0028110959|nr:hypothetical protein [Saccharothrix sp.]
MSFPLTQPPPRYVRLHPDRARHIRSRCAAVGVPLSVAAGALVVVIIVAGLRLPTARDPFNSLVWAVGAAAALCGFLATLGLAGARPYVVNDHLDLNGARVTRRVLGAVWTCTTVVSAFTCLLFVLLVTSGRSATKGIAFAGWAWAYLAALALPAVLSGIAFFTARALFRPAVRLW